MNICGVSSVLIKLLNSTAVTVHQAKFKGVKIAWHHSSTIGWTFLDTDGDTKYTIFCF